MRYLPIHAASRYSSEEVVELLLQWGADPEVLSIYERLSPLSLASVCVNLGAFKALMKFGANLNACRDIGFYPLLLVSRNLVDKSRSKVFETLNSTPTTKEVIEMIRLILEYPEVDVDRQVLAGFTALHFACEGNCREAVELLLNAGANSMIRSVRGYTPADMSSDPDIRQLLEDYKSDHPVTVIGYRKNIGPARGRLEAVCFTRRRQRLVSSEGANIEAGSGSSVSKRQESGISLAIPENALSQPVALILNYTPTPPVLQMLLVQRLKALPCPSEQLAVTNSNAVLPWHSIRELKKKKGGTQLISLTPPVTDMSAEAKETVISPFVTVTANSRKPLSKDALLIIPHCAQFSDETSKPNVSKEQFPIEVKRQSLSKGVLTDWETVDKSKVDCTDTAVNIQIDKLQESSTFAVVGKGVSRQRLQLWVLGNPRVEREATVAAVFCTNANMPAKVIVQKLEEYSSAKLLPWLAGYPLIAENDIRVEMSTPKKGWIFDPDNHEMELDILLPSSPIYPYYFCLYGESELKPSEKFICKCLLKYDEKEKTLAYFPKPIAERKPPQGKRPDKERVSRREAEGATEKGQMESTSGHEAKGNSVKREKTVEAEERCQTAVPEKADETEQKENSQWH